MNFLDYSSNQLLTFNYIYANIFCIIVFSIIIYKNIVSTQKRRRTKIFNLVLILHIIYFILEILWAPANFGLWQVSAYYLRVIRGFKYVTISVGTYAWFLYAENIIESSFTNDIKKIHLYASPALFSAVLGFILCLLFDSLDENVNKYTINIISTLIPFMYMIYTTIHTIIKTKKNKRLINKRTRITAAIYPLFLIIVAILQISNDMIPILCFGTTISILVIYLTNLAYLISTDALTNLNNRNEFNRYVYNNIKTNDNIFVAMFDIDKFKNINDTKGHIEGDKALVIVAKALKKAVGYDSRVFLARYGGDEFIAIFRDYTEEEIQNIFLNV